MGERRLHVVFPGTNLADLTILSICLVVADIMTLLFLVGQISSVRASVADH